MGREYRHLLSPGRIGPMELRNRLVMRKLGVSNRTQVALAASHLDVEKEAFPGISQEG